MFCGSPVTVRTPDSGHKRKKILVAVGGLEPSTTRIQGSTETFRPALTFSTPVTFEPSLKPIPCLASMRRHAQELSDEVLWAHVELYVNERTLDLGAPGREALRALAQLARERQLLPAGAAELQVL